MTNPMTGARDLGLVQVWDPYFWAGPADSAFTRDLHRAWGQWAGEDRVWLIPRSKKVWRWTSKWGHECSIPSETFNLLFVCNVDEAGRTYPRLLRGWNGILPPRLYRQWLEVMPLAVPEPKAFSMDVPVITDDRVSYEEREIGVELLPVMRIPDVDPNQKTLTLAWPDLGSDSTGIVSPEEDSNPLVCQFEHGHVVISHAGNPGQAGTHSGELLVSINARIAWPSPFDALFRTGSSIDLVYHQALMRSLSGQRRGEAEERTLRKTEAWVQALTGTTEVTLEKAWFLPKFAASPQEALFALEGSFGIHVSSPTELRDSEEVRSKLRQSVAVRRVVGWLGYFWLEFQRELPAILRSAMCRQCHRIISKPRANQLYCRREDKIECFRQRNKQVQRNRRTRLQNERITPWHG